MFIMKSSGSLKLLLHSFKVREGLRGRGLGASLVQIGVRPIIQEAWSAS